MTMITLPGNARSPAQRQAAYRARRSTAGDNGERRIDCWLSTAAALALARIARRRGMTQRQVLERLILKADRYILSTLDAESVELIDYLGETVTR